MYVLSIDFETFGPIPSKHGFTQLGAVIMNNDFKIISTFSMYSNMKGFTYDTECIKTFWEKEENKDIFTKNIESVKNAKYDPYEVIQLYWDWVKENIQNISIKDIHIISDNVAFDIGILKYFSNINIMTVFGEYRDIIDTCSVYYGMKLRPINTNVLNNESSQQTALEILRTHTGIKDLNFNKLKLPNHDALNDAINIANYWFFVQNTLQN